MHKRSKGLLAESLTCEYLQHHGLYLIERNFYCRTGEIDLIMRDRQHWVFVEVRYRGTRHLSRYGNGAVSINRRKQQRLLRASLFYMRSKHLIGHPARIDVVDVSGSIDAPVFNWIHNAVTEDGW